MALKYPDILKSNNPKSFGIVDAHEISGHKQVTTLDELYEISDCILGDNPIGLEWYVDSELAFYLLVDADKKHTNEGWVKRKDSYTKEEIDKKLADISVGGSVDGLKEALIETLKEDAVLDLISDSLRWYEEE